MGAALALTVGGQLAALPALPALAAVKDPRSIEVFYERDLVLIVGYPANTQVRIDVLRGDADVRVGRVTGTTDGAGLLEVNHGAPGDCWDAPATPDILPGDTVRTTVVDGTGADVDETVTRDVFVNLGSVVHDDVANSITVRGRARSLPNAPIAPGADTLELRLNKNNADNPWESSGRKDHRVDVGAAVLADGSWTHTVTGVSQDDMDDIAANGVAIAMEWSPVALTEGVIPEITVFDESEGIPPGCPPQRSMAVTESDPSMINFANQGQDLVLKGTSFAATNVQVTLDDAEPSTLPFRGDVTPSPSTGPQTWTLTVPAASVATLSEGTLTASSIHTTADGEVAGADLSIVKDLTRPVAPGVRRGNTWLTRTTLTTGPATATFAFGSAGDVPRYGDFDGNGSRTPAVYRPATGTFFLTNTANATGTTQSIRFGRSTDVPVVGDWDGNGVDGFGVFRSATSTWYLRNSLSAGTAQLSLRYGAATDVPLVDDWNSDRSDTPAVFRPSTSTWFLNNQSSGQGVTEQSFRFGSRTDKPLTWR